MTHHLVGMAEIAEMLGVSRQRVSQLVDAYDDFPSPEVELTAGRIWSRTAIETWIATHPERGPGRPAAIEEGVEPHMFGSASSGLFTRFTDRARNSVVKAQEEARLLQHNFIGTEHLLLGLLALGDGLAHDILVAHHVTSADCRRTIEGMIGKGPVVPTGHIPFTPRAKKVLELSMREALQLGHNYIGTEHILLGLVREKDGVAWQSLEKLGMSRKSARKTILEAMSGASVTVPETFDPNDDLAEIVRKLEERIKKLEEPT